MAQEELEIAIDAMGRVTVKTIGIKGPRCLDYAEAVALILGREESHELTSEYYEAQQTARSHVDVKHTR
jgi:Protein of unknown function (DUF2997)